MSRNDGRDAGTQYRVVGNHAVLGVQPGETFTAELDPEREQHLITAGHIKPVESDSASIDPTGDGGEEQ